MIVGTRKPLYGVGINDWDNLVYVDKKAIPEYGLWSGVVERCYSEKWLQKRPTYRDVTMDSDWLYMTRFIDDVSKIPNYDKWKTDGWNLDKDILFKGNRHYSKDTCCFVPPHINNLFTKSNKIRGNFPIGVQHVNYPSKSSSKTYGYYRVQLNIDGKVKTTGHFKTVEEAFNQYKTLKEAEIKRVATLWKGIIADNVYHAMMNYQVEITD